MRRLGGRIIKQETEIHQLRLILNRKLGLYSIALALYRQYIPSVR